VRGSKGGMRTTGSVMGGWTQRRQKSRSGERLFR
jgi:hypothetical protein